ncbi:hypothetical protein V1477_015938 [Vespula maculifrons]|uniref:Uncharacterized protein n=2 Tax=Vespula TaxID=7451 RepID=A0A834K1Y7_VESVU|nr:hypothetical protein HZH66_006498 [Vespula vulgaris]
MERRKKGSKEGSDSARVSLIAAWKSANARINIAVTPQRRSRIATYPPDIPAYGCREEPDNSVASMEKAAYDICVTLH